MHARSLLSLAIALLCLLAGCASAPLDSTTPTPDDTTAAPSPAPSSSPGSPSPPPSKPSKPSKPSGEKEPAAGTTVPDILKFRATTATGRRLDGASLAGRPTLFWFWAPWCPQCRGQIPQVQRIARAYAGEVNVVGVGSLDDAAAIRGFADDVVEVTHLVDEDGSLWRRFEVVEQSSFVLIDQRGKEVLRSGYGESPDLTADLDQLLD